MPAMANPERLVIMGGSAGGFTVLNALIHHPGFFKLGISRYGVSNLFMLEEDTHKFESHYNTSLLGGLPEYHEQWQARSPIFQANQIKDALLIFQGSVDPVVPQSQSDSLVEQLQANNVPHLYRVYEGEGHGFRQVENIIDYYKNHYQLFNEHFGTKPTGGMMLPKQTPETRTFTASDGQKLFTKHGANQKTRKACILLSAWLWANISNAMNTWLPRHLPGDYCLIGFDQRGHGQTEGKRGVIVSPKRFMADLDEMLGYAQSLIPNKPVFLYGHSLGALEVLYYSLTAKPAIAGVIATSPPLDTATTSKSQRFLVGMLKKLLPNLTVPSQLSTNDLSRDPEIVKAYVNDPLVHDQVSVALGGFLIDGAEYILEHADEWQLPLYLAHGDADAICLTMDQKLLWAKPKWMRQ